MSLSSSSQTTTIEIKITPERKVILERAATSEGLSLDEYILKVATDTAEKYFVETEAIALSDKDWETVISAIDDPPELNDALKAAINRYRHRRPARLSHRTGETPVLRVLLHPHTRSIG